MGCSPPPARLGASHSPESENREGRAQRGDQEKKLAAQGAEAAGSSPESTRAVIRADAATWARVITQAGLRASEDR